MILRVKGVGSQGGYEQKACSSKVASNAQAMGLGVRECVGGGRRSAFRVVRAGLLFTARCQAGA